MELTNVLQAPVVTEKTTAAQAQHKYTFFVHPAATKVDVARAIQSAYGVKAVKVNFIRTLKKVRLIGRGRTMTKRPARKKAMVTVGPKDSIDVNKFKK